MRCTRAVFAGAVMVALLAVSPRKVDATDGRVELKQLPAVAKGVAALPRIAAPDTAGARINADLDKMDRGVRQYIRDCRKNSPKEWDWEREWSVAMRGPGYLSLNVTDNSDCGGPHPSSDQFVLVYDLKTGAQVRWPSLLSASAKVKQDDSDAQGSVASPVLTKLYLALRKKQLTGDDADPECDASLVGMDISYYLWPDAEHGALALKPADLPHVMLPCGDEVYLGDAEMRALGVPDAMRAAIKIAHDAQGATKQSGSSNSR